MARGNAGQVIFKDDQDCRVFLLMLREAKERYGVLIFAWCLMVNHLHLLVRTGQGTITAFMQSLLRRYSGYFNRRHGRYGRNFQDRFRAPIIDSDRYLREVMRYIAMNPVKAKMVDNPEKWPWSSHRALLGLGPDPVVDVDAALGLFGETEAQARAAYLDWLYREDDEEAQNRIEEALEKDERVLIEDDKDPLEETMESIGKRVASSHGFSPALVWGPSRARNLTAPRIAFVAEALKAGFRPIDIARFLGRSPSSVTRLIDAAPKRK